MKTNPSLRISGISLLALFSTALPAQEKPSDAPAAAAPGLVWGRQWGTPADDFGRTIAVDRAGRCYVAGGTQGDLAGKSAGKADAFVAAFDAAGERVWMISLGSAEDEQAVSLAVAPDGTLYVGGTTTGKLGSQQFGGRDVFLTKLDASGQVLRSQQFGSAADDDCGAITCDAHGNVFLAGTTAGKIGETQHGDQDAFLLKLDSAGDVGWSHQWGTAGADVCAGLAMDVEGHLYVTGSTTGAFEGAANAGDRDVFVSQLDTTGKLLWNRQYGTAAPDQGMNLCVDSKRSIYIGGSSGGEFAGPQLGGGDAVLLKLSPAGELLWKKQFGTTRWDGIHGIAFSGDGAERVIVGGCQNWDQCQGFLREFDHAGVELWPVVIPSDQTICGTKIAVDANGDIYQTGGTHGPAFGDYRGPGNDIILVKFFPRKKRAGVPDSTTPSAVAD